MRYFLLESNSFNKPLLLNDQSYACTLTHIHITSSDYICPIIRGFFGCTHRLSSCNCCRNVFGLKVKDHWPKPRVLDTLPILASILGYICFEALSYRRNHFQDFLGRISRQTVQMKLVYEILCGFYRSEIDEPVSLGAFCDEVYWQVKKVEGALETGRMYLAHKFFRQVTGRDVSDHHRRGIIWPTDALCTPYAFCPTFYSVSNRCRWLC